METGGANVAGEEAKIKDKYGGLPKKNELVMKRMNKAGDRKYFDSGDYALCQAGKQTSKPLGQEIPNPESIPHKDGSAKPKHSKLAEAPPAAN